MKRYVLIIVVLISSININAQKDSTYRKKNRLPYNKYKGMKLLYVKLSPSFQLNTEPFDYALDIRTAPVFAYYLNKKTELLGEYGFTFVKYGSSYPVHEEGFNQFSTTIHYYPFSKLNFIYAEAGLNYGNYIASNVTNELVKEWNLASLLGFGIEILTRKRLIVNFNAALVLPFNQKYKVDFVRSIGLGLRLKKKNK